MFALPRAVVAKAQLFADELGCLVIAPDTFRGVSSTFIPQCIWLALSTPQQRVNDDLDDAIAWAVAEADCERELYWCGRSHCGCRQQPWR